MDLFNKIFRGDKVIWIVFLFLCLISIIEVFSAASTLTYKSGDHWGPITQHSLLLMAGTFIVIGVHRIPYKWFKVLPVVLYPASIIMLILVMAMGLLYEDFRVNGASRWLSFGGIAFQPSEFGKMACIIMTASFLSWPRDNGDKRIFRLILGTVGLICALIVPENLSTAMLLFGVVFIMMFVGGISLKKLGALIGTGAALGALLMITAYLIPDEKQKDIPLIHRLSTWEKRLESFGKDEVPAAEFDVRNNAQEAHSMIAIASSNIIGRMPGNSVQRDFLSQAFSDFIFAIIIEELGLIGGAFVVILYIIILIRAGKIAQKCDRTFPAFLVTGIALLLVSQALLNMMVATGLFPITGQPLPLISKGGTSTFINCAYIGMILSISQYTEKIEKSKHTQKEPSGEHEDVRSHEGPEEPTSEFLNNEVEMK